MSCLYIDGEKLFYEEFGSGEPVFLLHGNTVSGKFFTPIIPLLAEKYHVITLDFLGCGRTPMAKSHIFEHGGHPAMMSNMDSFVSLCDKLFECQESNGG